MPPAGLRRRAPPDLHRLRVVAPGREPTELSIDVQPEGWAGDVYLTPSEHAFETVVTAGSRGAVVRMTGDEARKTPGTGGDPFRVIESLPGVSQVLWPLAIYAIRGANPGNTGFFVDGVRVPALFHFALGPSVIHPYLVENLTFHPGGYPARYGGYVSGVVLAETHAPPPNMTRFAADLRLYDAGALAAASWDAGRGTVVAAARYSYAGLLVSRLSSNVSFGYADYQLRADHSVGDGRATLLALGSFDALDIQNGGVGDASLNFHRLDLRWERPTLGGRLSSRATFGTDRARSAIYDSPIAVSAYSVAPQVAYLRALSPNASIDLGVSAEAQRFDTTVVYEPGAPPFSDIVRNRSVLSGAVYGAALLDWGRLRAEPGIRYAQYFEQGTARGGVEPRLRTRLRLADQTSIDAGIGRFSQMPSLPIAVAGFEGFSLRDLGLQTSTQVSVGAETSLLGISVLRIASFYQWLWVSDLRNTFARDVREQDLLEMREGRGYGLEVLLRMAERQRMRGWIAYTLSWSQRDFQGVRPHLTGTSGTS